MLVLLVVGVLVFAHGFAAAMPFCFLGGVVYEAIAIIFCRAVLGALPQGLRAARAWFAGTGALGARPSPLSSALVGVPVRGDGAGARCGRGLLTLAMLVVILGLPDLDEVLLGVASWRVGLGWPWR